MHAGVSVPYKLTSSTCNIPHRLHSDLHPSPTSSTGVATPVTSTFISILTSTPLQHPLQVSLHQWHPPSSPFWPPHLSNILYRCRYTSDIHLHLHSDLHTSPTSSTGVATPVTSTFISILTSTPLQHPLQVSLHQWHPPSSPFWPPHLSNILYRCRYTSDIHLHLHSDLHTSPTSPTGVATPVTSTFISILTSTPLQHPLQVSLHQWHPPSSPFWPPHLSNIPYRCRYTSDIHLHLHSDLHTSPTSPTGVATPVTSTFISILTSTPLQHPLQVSLHQWHPPSSPFWPPHLSNIPYRCRYTSDIHLHLHSDLHTSPTSPTGVATPVTSTFISILTSTPLQHPLQVLLHQWHPPSSPFWPPHLSNILYRCRYTSDIHLHLHSDLHTSPTSPTGVTTPVTSTFISILTSTPLPYPLQVCHLFTWYTCDIPLHLHSHLHSSPIFPTSVSFIHLIHLWHTTSSPFSPSSLSHIPYRCVTRSPAALVTPPVTTSISTLTSTHFLTSPYRCAVYSPTVPCHHPDHHPYLTFQVGV